MRSPFSFPNESRQIERKELSKKDRFLGPAIFVAGFLIALILVYLGSRPKTYHLNVSDASPYDIEAPISIVNHAETMRRATEAMAQVSNKMSRSDEISKNSVLAVEEFIDLAQQARVNLHQKETGADPTINTEVNQNINQAYQFSIEELTEASERLQDIWKEVHGTAFDLNFSQKILEMSDSRFQVFSNNLSSAATVIMNESLDDNGLSEAISNYVTGLKESVEYYSEDVDLIEICLRNLLDANLVFNKEATENAQKDAFNRVQQNPIMINRGTRIVSEGDIITEEIYAILDSLKLIDAGAIDWTVLSGQFILISTLTAVLWMYLKYYRRDLLVVSRESFSLLVSLLIPLLISASIGQSYQLAPPVSFAAVVVSAYFGFETSLVFSSCLLVAILPMVNFNPGFFMVGFVACIVAAVFTQGVSNQDNFAKLILATASVNALTSASYALMQGYQSTAIMQSVTETVISGVASVIAAIGIMPLFEMFFNTVSPIRLIELSQPGHPLMRRLFLEAPGTSQHSMMVANLADAAAEALGANAMICRVGAYYHDIGKLENPIMFTENQMDYNPHDYLSAMESARIITRHPEEGIKLGRKYHLPQQVLRIIEEHHGTTVLQYFYQKEKEEAELQGRELPDPELFRYQTTLPSSRESAIVMLADSTEAAIKSSKASSMEEAEQVMQNVFKIKNDQNQLKQSGLSFADVDKMMQAFLQVYSGHFHERVKYKDASSETYSGQQAETI